MGSVPVFLANLSNCAQTALSLQRHSMTSMLGHRVRTSGRAIRWVLSKEASHGEASGHVGP